MKKNIAVLFITLIGISCFAMDNKSISKKKLVKRDDGSLVYKNKVLVDQKPRTKKEFLSH